MGKSVTIMEWRSLTIIDPCLKNYALHVMLFQDENLHRCSISADSQIENSLSDDSSDDENMDMKDNGYHDAENEVDQDTDNDPERAHSGKLSESSGSAGSDLYDYKVLLYTHAYVSDFFFLPFLHVELVVVAVVMFLGR